MNRLSKQIIALAFLLTLLPLGACVTTPETGDTSYPSRSNISYMLGIPGDHFRGGINLVETEDSEGNSYYIGEITPELDAELAALVDFYNADPSTTEAIILEEVRYSLTEGLSEATQQEDSAFREFLKWLGGDADLVYRENGAEVGGSSTSNYYYVTHRDSTLESFCSSWEYEHAITQ